MRKNLLVLLVCLLTGSGLLAQTRSVSGRVTSAEDGSALPGVSILVKGKNTGTITDAEGRYKIDVSSGETIVYSFIGLKQTEVVVGESNVIDVALAQDATQLSEVVVTGYGVQAKREVTGSISSVKGAAIEGLPMQSFDRAIQGRAAGVQVTSSGGQPGGGVTVNIRGTGTINGSTQPLYIIDGVQVNAGTIGGTTSSNALTSINPADIESIEVLKDAAAASIYGTLAGNGVVIVTTKRGKSGKSKIKFSAQYGISERYNPYNVLSGSDWLTLRAEAIANLAKKKGLPYQQAYDDAIDYYEATYGDGDSDTPIPSYNWVDAISNRGKLAQYDLSVSGGDEKTRFYISGSYNSVEGTIFGSSFKRGTTRANIDHKLTEKLTLETTLGLTASLQRGFGANAGFFSNGPFTGGLFMAPIVPIYNEDGTYNQTLLGNTYNMVQLLKEELRTSGVFQTVSNLGLNYSIMPGLNFRAFAGVDFSDIKDFSYRPATIPGYAPGTGAETFRRNVTWNTNYTLTYAKKLNAHNISALVGFEYRNNFNTTLGTTGQTFASPKLILLSSAGTPTATASTFTGYKLAGYFMNAKYDFKDKYLASLTLRYDGSSRFGADNRYGLFYGLSGGWRISAEDFMSSLQFVSDLKLRASYGVVGVQPTGDFQSMDLYGNSGQYNNLPGIGPSQLGNPGLTWEESATVDVGLDFAFFNNRVYGSIDLWKKNNTKLLLNQQIPGDTGIPANPTLGYSSIFVNLGEVENKGIDFEISTVNLDVAGLKWVSSFNIGLQKNEILDLGPGVDRIGNTYIVGKPLGMLYTRTWAGVNPADGRPMYYDRNGDITYNPAATDQKYQGSTIPSHFGGLTNTLKYKGVTLEVFFQYQYGNESLLQAQQVLEYAGAGEENQTRNQLDRWTRPGQVTSVPKPIDGGIEIGGYDPTNLTSRFIQTASYIRLKQITLSYQLPSAIISRAKMSNVNVFVQAINLATFTNFRGDDPENAIGNNLNQYPNPRQITAGVTIEF